MKVVDGVHKQRGNGEMDESYLVISKTELKWDYLKHKSTEERKYVQDSIIGEVLIPFLGTQRNWVPL